MAVNVRRVVRDQQYLMPPSVTDWLPADHLAFFVVDVVTELDLTAFAAGLREDGRGGAAYDPEVLVSVLLYAYCTGERSSRRVERRLVEDVAYRVIAANQTPDHATIARFRRRHQSAIAGLFVQVLGLCVQAGLVDAGLVAIDGTKVAADASFFANHTREQLVAAILAEAEEVDTAEHEQFGGDRGDELPDGWGQSQGRRERIRAALQQVDAQTARDYDTRMQQRAAKEAATGRKVRGPKPKAQPARTVSARRANVTDPDSRIIATGTRGALQGYNAQAAATAGQVIVAAEVSATTNDQPHFLPMVQSVKDNLAAAGSTAGIGTVVADAGYWTAANGTAEVGANVLIATRKGSWRRAQRPSDDKLAVLARVNRGELSQRKAGEILGVSYTWVRDMTKRYFGQDGQRLTTTRGDVAPEEWIPVIERVDRGEISRRAAVDQLGVSDTRAKNMLAHVRGEAIDSGIALAAMDAKLADPDNAARYRCRQHTIEPVFGNIKANLGYRRFQRRGLASVDSEWRLICASHNLLKLRKARKR